MGSMTPPPTHPFYHHHPLLPPALCPTHTHFLPTFLLPLPLLHGFSFEKDSGGHVWRTENRTLLVTFHSLSNMACVAAASGSGKLHLAHEQAHFWDMFIGGSSGLLRHGAVPLLPPHPTYYLPTTPHPHPTPLPPPPFLPHHHLPPPPSHHPHTPTPLPHLPPACLLPHPSHTPHCVAKQATRT